MARCGSFSERRQVAHGGARPAGVQTGSTNSSQRPEVTHLGMIEVKFGQAGKLGERRQVIDLGIARAQSDQFRQLDERCEVGYRVSREMKLGEVVQRGRVAPDPPLRCRPYRVWSGFAAE